MLRRSRAIQSSPVKVIVAELLINAPRLIQIQIWQIQIQLQIEIQIQIQMCTEIQIQLKHNAGRESYCSRTFN